MVPLIFGVLALYVFQTYLPAIIMSRALGPKALHYAGGPRDEPLPLTINAGRAKRALENMNEAMVVFIPLSLLAVHFGLNDGGLGLARRFFLLLVSPIFPLTLRLLA